MTVEPRILVVEDDDASREMLTRRLVLRGFNVRAVEEGEACLAAFPAPPPVAGLSPPTMPVKQSGGPGSESAFSPDLVLLDVNLPGQSGIDVLRRLRTRYTHDMLPIILVTALGESDDVVRGLEAGANDYVVKPVDLPVLLARIQVCLKIKYGVSLLMEAERQRVMMETLAEACDQIAQPTTAISCMLEAILRQNPCDLESLRGDLREVLSWTKEVASLIHKLRAVTQARSSSYLDRMEMLERGTVKDRFRRKV